MEITRFTRPVAHIRPIRGTAYLLGIILLAVRRWLTRERNTTKPTVVSGAARNATQDDRKPVQMDVQLDKTWNPPHTADLPWLERRHQERSVQKRSLQTETR